jgi:hypothetical protein
MSSDNKINIGRLYINQHGNLCLRVASKSYLRIDRIIKAPKFFLFGGNRTLQDYTL